MRVRDLRLALEQIRDVFDGGGAVAQARDLQRVADMLAKNDGADLTSYLDDVRSKLQPATPERYVEALRNAGFDEDKFKAVIADMRADRNLDKDGVHSVGEGYGVIRLSGRGKDSLIDSIEKHFYWLVYNRDADEMAKRATPW